jgi:type I restriction enzyme S subunit
MARERKVVSLGEICDFRAGTTFKPSFQGQLSGRYPFVKVSDMNLPANAVRIQEANNWVSEADLHELRAKPFPPKTVVFAKIGEALRQNRLRQVVRETIVDNNMMGAVPRGNRVDPDFFYYALSQFDFSDIAQGTALPYLTLPSLTGLTLTIPPIDEQHSIARILGALDDRIELNRKMNEVLEAMARALFKSWFIDFDPVRAKAAGRDPGLPADIAALFPDSFEDSDLGQIPKGWSVGSVDDDFELTMGQSPPGETYNEAGDGLPFYQGSSDFGVRFPTWRVYCTAPTRFASAGDTLVSVRAPVGDVNMATEHCAIGRGVAAVRHKTGSRSFTYQFMRSISEVFARFDAEGTVFGSIGKKDFHAIACVRPSHNAVLSFERCLLPIDSRIEVNERESRTLAALRDALLPKLLSGELRPGATELPMSGIVPASSVLNVTDSEAQCQGIDRR